MKKSIKKVLSLALVLVMLCSMMSISAFATEDDPVVTVYFTRDNFTTGGYDFAHDTYIPSVYQGTSPAPAATTAFSSDLFPVQVHLNQINTTTTKSYYNASYSGAMNALDVIITALINNGRTPSCGWDSYGGAIYGFANDGSTDYYGYTIYEDEDTGDQYYHYTGTNWQIAHNTTSGGTLAAAASYATSITNLFDGMVIVMDLSAYDMYYKIVS